MAGVKETATWENHVYQIEENDPVHGGEEGVTNKPIKHLANRTLYLRKLLTEAGQQIQPKKITGASKNSVDLTGHTHEVESASIYAKGLVQLTNDTGLDSESLALTAKAGKALAQSIAQAKLDATNGLNKKVDKTSISDAVDSPSQTTVASSRAAKTAYDKGVEALNKANTKADSVNPILTTNKWYGDMNTVPDGTLFFAISETTKNHPYSGVATFDAQAWQFDVGNQIIQMVFYSQTDIKIRLNDDGVNWSDWNSILTTRNLSSAVNNPSDSVPASVAGVKTAYDHANTANQNANSRVKQAGAYAQIEVDNAGYAGLNIIRSGSSGNWSSRLEALPDRKWKFWTNSDGNGYEQYIKAENGTFAFLSDITKALNGYIPNSQKSNAVDSVSTYTVATSRAVKLAYDRANTANNNADGRVSKSGDTMTGDLTLSGNHVFNIKHPSGSEFSVGCTDNSRTDASGWFRFKIDGTYEYINFPKKGGYAVLSSEFSNNGGENRYVKTDSAGDIVARCFRNNYHNESRIQGAIAFRVNNSTDNYTRFCDNPDAVMSWLKADKLITESIYPSHYAGAKVLKLRVTTGGGWKLLKMRFSNTDYTVPASGEMLLNLPEAMSMDSIINVSDDGNAKYSYGAKMISQTQIKVFAPAGKKVGLNIQIMGGGSW